MTATSETVWRKPTIPQKILGVPCVPRPAGDPDSGAKENPDQAAYRVCVHESGHAVFIMYLGYELGPMGVRLTEEGNGRCASGGVTNPHENALIAVAGLLAEWEWCCPGSQLGATSFDSAHYAHHLLIDADTHPESDAAEVMRLAAKLLPRDPDRLMTRWIMDGRYVLRDRGVWNTVIAVANALYGSSSRWLAHHDISALAVAVLGLETRTDLCLPESGLAVGLRRIDERYQMEWKFHEAHPYAAESACPSSGW